MLGSMVDDPVDVSIVVEEAAAAEADAVLTVLREAAAGRSAAPKTTWGERFPDVIAAMDTGGVQVARLQDDIVGCFLLRWSDERVWGANDADAGYLHRLAVRPAFAGRRIGEQMVNAAAGQIAAAGRHWLRLDCDPDNPGLRRYYERLNFDHVCDVSNLPRTTRPGFRAASLYERSVDAGSRNPDSTSP